MIETIQFRRARVGKCVLGFSHAIVRMLPNSGQTGSRVNNSSPFPRHLNI